MNVLLVGGGGREHALALALRRSKNIDRLYALPGNAGIAAAAECAPVAATDIDGICAFAAAHDIDYAVVAPDDPLAMGAIDRLAAMGIPGFGPTAAAARIESSKLFAKSLMADNGIPTARYRSFTEPDAALGYIGGLGYPAVIKADGLALGKGVFIVADEAEAKAALDQLMRDRVFGASGDRVLVEEFLTGPEVTVLAFTDGETVVPMVSSMDHKRALDGDRGPNTGGMGVVAPNPFYTPDIAARCMEEIFLPTVRAMAAMGCPFKGCLYFGLMLTADGPRVIEYNCRFGDPEAEAVLTLFDGDLLEVMQAVTEGRLSPDMARFSPDAACTVIIASGGYPGKYAKSLPIDMGRAETRPGVTVYHCGTALKDGRPVTAGGRVLAVTARAVTPREARRAAYEAAADIDFDGAFYRRDIGTKAKES